MASSKLSLMELPIECRSQIIDEVLAISKPHIELTLSDETWNLPQEEFEAAHASLTTEVEVNVENAPHPLLLVCRRLYQETCPKISISATYRVLVSCGDEEYVWEHVTPEARELIDELTIIGYSINISEIPDLNIKHLRLEEIGNDAVFFISPGDKFGLQYINLSSDNMVATGILERVENRHLDDKIAEQMCSQLGSSSEYSGPYLSDYTGSEEDPDYSVTFVLKLRMWLTHADIWTSVSDEVR